MRTTVLVLLALSGGLLLALYPWAQPAEAQDPAVGATYVGGAKCKKCHITHFRAWTKMKHAKAWDNLPKKFRSPDRKDDQGRACISCHVTGFGEVERGGFKDAKQSDHLLGVQCESCHGLGSKHREKADAAAKADQKLVPPFLITRKPTNCADCHNPHVSYANQFGAGGGG
jgi:hypothetical protein